MNVYGGNEHRSHAIRPLEAILKDCSDISSNISLVRLCYEVACVFKPAMYHIHPDWIGVQVRTGRFYMYDHELSCYVLFNLLKAIPYNNLLSNGSGVVCFLE